MSAEIERKFVVHEPPADLVQWTAERIDQGYLAITDDVEVRVRRKGKDCFLTVKSAPALIRVEEELAISDAQFGSLWSLTDGRRVRKTRYTRRFDTAGPLLELDRYDDELAGLMTLEVEFPDVTAAERFVMPAWAGDEVTGDRRYSNQALALHGRPA